MGSLSDRLWPLGDGQALWHPLRASLACTLSCPQLQAGFACSFKSTSFEEKKEQRNIEGVAGEAGIACSPHGHLVSPLLIINARFSALHSAYSRQRDGGDRHTKSILQVSEKDAGSALLC